MSYLHRTTLEDFDEAWRYGATLTLDELESWDRLINKLIKDQGEDSEVVKHVIKVRENYL
jgi:methionine synthase II (cobalamin-independent)